ncbi:MAG: UDP-galactopyranose mutase, partial [Lachnospiraceae bacterium]
EFKENQIYYQGERFKGNVIYTGALDELFRCEYGRLPYRSLRFEFQHYEQPDFQGHSVVNYTISQDYTRITEFKYLTGQDIDSTTVVREYPFAYTGKEGEIPYYAIINEENQILYEKYQKLAEKYDRLYLLGRLAEYKYYNIDAMVDRALLLSEKIMRGEK